MKLKVKVIMISLKGNKVAKAGEVVDTSQLVEPGNWKKLIEDGYLVHTKSSLAELEAIENAKKSLSDADGGDSSDDSDADGEVYLEDMSKKQLIKFASDNDIRINPKDKKGDIFSTISKALSEE